MSKIELCLDAIFADSIQQDDNNNRVVMAAAAKQSKRLVEGVMACPCRHTVCWMEQYADVVKGKLSPKRGSLVPM